ncbi:dipeptidase [Lutimonas halocynthiae]|uniref:dipeptidase n=1 Tax=Lutimonas halocynthiae TaxID=1446477 RepID=UPI0025B59D94|nr:dipeptidase [Lutimonas halocynthiae]MDN3644086.1 dipeptidase [Lutimonas halocynthiae]
MKKTQLSLLLFFISLVLTAQSRPPESENSRRERALKIHESVITIDTHNDINIANFTAEKNYTQDLDTQVNLPKMITGGLDVSWLIVYTGQGSLDKKGYKKAYENAISKFDAIHRLTEVYAADQIELALSSDDVKRIQKEGKKVVMIGVENAYPIGEDLNRIEEFYNKGARYMSLAHNGHSQFSDSNTGEQDSIWLHNGLSELGKKAIVEMNRLGIMIDLSHPSKKANIQMIQLSKAPVIASHSSARGLSDVSRNLDDEVLKMIKNNGGVVQTVALADYVSLDKVKSNNEASQPIYDQVAKELGVPYLTMTQISKLRGEELHTAYNNYDMIMKKAGPLKKEINKQFPLVNVRDFVDHIDYMVKLIGVDHVGISSDFDGGGGIQGWDNASETFNITYELVRRGYSETDIAKIWGLNLLRVLDEVDAIAKKLKATE